MVHRATTLLQLPARLSDSVYYDAPGRLNAVCPFFEFAERSALRPGRLAAQVTCTFFYVGFILLDPATQQPVKVARAIEKMSL